METKTELVGEAIRPALDMQKAGEFTQRTFGDIIASFTTAMAVIGDRLGLFKNLAAGGAATSDELAQRAGVNERYVREWLSAMACAGYIDYDPSTLRFSLPSEHAPALADEDGPMFVGGIFNLVPPMMGVLDKVAQSFRMGGGVAMSDYDASLWEAIERETAPTFENALLQTWLPTAPEIRAKLEQGALVADIGCGAGRALIKLAKAFPNSHFVGYDAHLPQVERATANAASAHLTGRVRFEHLNVSGKLPERYDIITTFDVVHDATDPVGLLHGIRASLNPDGLYFLQEFNSADKLEDNIGPRGAFFYSASVLYCMTTSLAHGGEGWGTAGMPESKVRALAAEVGFSAVRRLPIDDPFSALYVLQL